MVKDYNVEAEQRRGGGGAVIRKRAARASSRHRRRRVMRGFAAVSTAALIGALRLYQRSPRLSSPLPASANA
ncbi:hypothetical protein SKAU_G00380650 [Synaphobranchus kaupii]|uniref:Uncharacterized protein n=1 Tax=Synaphobranchus kaupii TaxID=118154 RepID=A0A9Q1EDK2_SYNKA|nr:hypothetical protein SKAU_G00380650 [Synaphobranchus kaupii]